MKLRTLFLIGFAAAATFVGCKEDEVDGTPSIKLSETTVTIGEEESSQTTITLTSTRDWVAEIPSEAKDWLKIDPAAGSASNDPQTVTITALAANTGNNRTVKVTFNASIVSETLTVTQEGPGGENAYQDFLDAADGAEFTLEGLVVGINQSGVIINEGASNVIVYNGNSEYKEPANVKIGDKVSVSGEKDIFNNFPELAITSYDAITVLSSDNAVDYPDPYEVTAETYAGLNRTSCIYIQYEGLLTISGYNYNVTIDGLSNQGSLKNPIEALGVDELEGKRVLVKGYQYAGGGDFIHTLVTSIEESTSPYLTVSPLTVTIPANGGQSEIAVTGNVEWTVTNDENSGFTVSSTGGNGADSFTISAEQNNTGAVKNATITVSTTAEVATKTYTISVTQPAAIEEPMLRADFETFNEGKTSTSYIESTTTSGWKATNCAILTGGETDNSPKFICIGKVEGTENYAVAACMNGKTDAVGTIESPVLNDGCGVLSFDYAYVFADKNGVSFKVEILQGEEVVKTFTVENATAAQKTAYNSVYDVNVAGDFKIKFTNLSPSNASGNADRFAVWNVEWTNYSAE